MRLVTVSGREGDVGERLVRVAQLIDGPIEAQPSRVLADGAVEVPTKLMRQMRRMHTDLRRQCREPQGTAIVRMHEFLRARQPWRETTMRACLTEKGYSLP